MSALAIAWEYLTGYAVATDYGDRERAEFPPHPGRVFLALAAAWFETGEDDEEGAALRWLERLGDPELHLPPSEDLSQRSTVTFYVPVNDKVEPASAPIQSAPALTRSRQPRMFPRRWVGHAPCYLAWPSAEGVEQHYDALARLCSKVTRIGHSSSLVRMWIADTIAPDCSVWIADDGLADCHCRVATPGTLDALPVQTQIPRIKLFAELDTRIRSTTGEAHKQAKAEYEQLFGASWSKSASPPALLRPKLGAWRGYRRAEAPTTTSVAQSIFDAELLVLTPERSERPLPGVSTLAVARALRNTIMSRSALQPVPGWVSGHEPNGDPQRTNDDAHMACIPLPFVGHEHSDGHLLGVAIAFPRSVPRRDRGKVLGPLLLNPDGEPQRIQLNLGAAGQWRIRKREWSDSRYGVRPETWTASPEGAWTWASVTPVVLDRFPKADRHTDRSAWTEEVAEIVGAACVRIGLPLPESVDVDTTSWHRGSPRAVTKLRPLRGQHGPQQHLTASLGDGFPSYPAKGTNAARPQVHVWLRFTRPVIGPVLLGAGRYLGYGLCKPLTRGRP